MAGREDQGQELVAEIVVQGRLERRDPVGLGIPLARQCQMHAIARPVATDCVDAAALGGGHQPGAWIGRNAFAGPIGQGCDDGILGEFLGAIDVAHDAGQTRDEPGPFKAKNRFDRPPCLTCSH